MRRLSLLFVVAACSGGGDGDLTIETVTPAFGPLSGGTRIVITGSGFMRDSATPNRVLFAGRESPQAGAVDDATLEVIVPEGDMAGDAEITVFNRNGNVTTTGKFKYSAAPTITSVSPSNVLFSSTTTMVTVTGTGFQDEDAGRPTLLIDGEAAIDVTVTSDTELVFTAKPGIVMSRPDLELVNTRGIAVEEDALRYVPSSTPGLWVFPKGNNVTFALFYDPVTDTTVNVPKRDPSTSQFGYRAIFTDIAGDYWVYGRDNKFGKLDLEAQTVVDPQQMNTPRTTSLVRAGSTVFSVIRGPFEFGTFNPTTRTFSTIAALGTCCNLSLASDGTTMYSIVTNTIAPINMTTGARTAPKPLTPSVEVGEMRFLGGMLYGVGGNQGNVNQILRIDPATGMTTVIKTFNGVNLSAIELYQP